MHNADIIIFRLLSEESGAEREEGARGKFENCETGFVDYSDEVRGFVFRISQKGFEGGAV